MKCCTTNPGRAGTRSYNTASAAGFTSALACCGGKLRPSTMRCCILTALHWWCLLLLSARDYGSHQATARALSLLLLCPWCLKTVNKRLWRIFNLATFGKSDSGKVGVAAAALLEAWPSVQEVVLWHGVHLYVVGRYVVLELWAVWWRAKALQLYYVYTILLAARIYPVFPSQAKSHGTMCYYYTSCT